MNKKATTGPKGKTQSDAKLRKGESVHKKGTYQYRWTDEDGIRHSVYAQSLAELREQEEQIARDETDYIKPEGKQITVNGMFEVWQEIKRGVRDNTMQNYIYMYNMFVAPVFGKKRIPLVTKSEVKRFYNSLLEDRGVSISTVDTVQNVLHQVFDLAVDDNYIRRNPTDNVMKELKQVKNVMTEKKRALTKKEQDLFLSFLRRSEEYSHWYPVFAVMLGTGMRVGEVTGLRWCDIDLQEGIIDVNHTLVLYKHVVNGTYFNIHAPKTNCGIRVIPMLSSVKEAFLMEKESQMKSGVKCSMIIDGYSGFIFVNRFGEIQHQGTLNKALRRIIRDCNEEIIGKGKANPVLLPHFSCHNLRHTFATRLCEAGVNVKVIQDTLGHADVKTTLNIYADATMDLKRQELRNFEAAITGSGDKSVKV